MPVTIDRTKRARVKIMKAITPNTFHHCTPTDAFAALPRHSTTNFTNCSKTVLNDESLMYPMSKKTCLEMIKVAVGYSYHCRTSVPLWYIDGILSTIEFTIHGVFSSFLCTGREVILQWIPSHCGIHGNVQADKLAKEASTLHPPCLLTPVQNAKRLLRDKCRQKRISTLTDLGCWQILVSSARWTKTCSFSVLPRVEGIWHVSESSPVMIICKPICLRLALADSLFCPLFKSGLMAGKHLSDCPALLHVLSQDNYSVLLPARAPSALYWTARRLMSERTFAGVNFKK
ncbi:hypothetical protein TNCV_1259491 [Trichonephila clavipes]|nr:hypothetical protein TNCV_1259491 [Trichonephila clavipes]